MSTGTGMIGRLFTVAALAIAVGATLSITLGPKITPQPKKRGPGVSIVAVVPSSGQVVGGLYAGDGADQTRLASAITTPAPGGSIADVTMRRISFSPGTIHVRAGDAVRFTNNDNVDHTVSAATDPITGESGTYASPVLSPGHSYTVRFATRGTFSYFCAIHPTMVGTVVVS